jgi:hypothetical protein
MSTNQYENFKQGIKSDINNIASSLFLIGGLLLLVVVMFTGLYVAIKDEKMDSSLRLLLGFSVLILGGVMIFNKKVLNLILGIWLILLIAAIVLPILFLIGYFFYQLFKQPYNAN